MKARGHDQERAVEWYRKAAEQGHKEAKDKLDQVLGICVEGNK